MKVCTKCQVEQPLINYHKGNGRLGKQSHCKNCQQSWVEQNNVALMEYKKQYHLNHKEKHNQASHDWYWKDREPPIKQTEEERKIYRRRWYQLNKVLCIARAKVGKSKRRVRVYQNGGQFTPREWLDICERFDGQCVCCGKKQALTPDHIIPISKGGRNDICNIQPLCLRCNLSKGTKTINYIDLVLVDN